MSDEWISVEEILPPMNIKIQLKRRRFCFKNDISEGIFIFNYEHSCYMFSDLFGNQIHVTHWRQIKEKRPDFSKLKYGDILAVEFIDDNRIIGSTFRGIREDIDIITLGGGADHRISCIKKITRINLKEKTFEEI